MKILQLTSYLTKNTIVYKITTVLVKKSKQPDHTCLSTDPTIS